MKTILVDAVGTLVKEEGGLYDDIYQLVDQYPNKKIILTNADYQSDNKYGLNDMPYEVFTLKHNPNKLDPDYYQRMLAHFELAPAEVIYFEQNKDAVKSAQSIGITTYHYDPNARDLDALRQFLDDNA